MQSSAHRIRNFSIIAHIDHGKTTLTDALLRATNSITEREFTERVMDSNPIEKERGITIKLAPVTMEFSPEGDDTSYILNLIDTPGHVDFSYEVSRSLAACEGALLVVDATQGIQAQTLSTFEKARELGLTIIPVLNKIDLPTAQPEIVSLELMELLSCSEEDIISVSAKTGKNVQLLLEAVISRIEPPVDEQETDARALLITSHFDQHRGAIGIVRVVDGVLSKEKLSFIAAGESFTPLELGIFSPTMQPTHKLAVGQVGYIATGLKDIRLLRVGDTLTSHEARNTIKPLAGYKHPQPMVFMELYPVDTAEYVLLQDAMEKLVLRDAALQYVGVHSAALGSGFRVGFLGILHAEIVLERFRREFGLELIATFPSVTYKVQMKAGEELIVKTPGEMPDPSQIEYVEEPIALLTILAPQQYVGTILQEVRERRGEFLDSRPVGERVRLQARVPLSEIITDFHDVLKSKTSGYASVEYVLDDYQTADIVKVTVLLNHEEIEALSFLTVKDRAVQRGRVFVEKLKEVVPRQMFELPIQAAIGGTIIARETLKAFRKDVTAKLYGGDVTRRKKLLAKQAKGKKRMKQFGKVELDSSMFVDILRAR